MHLKLKFLSFRLIPSRWVSAYKVPTKVRTRIVAKDLNPDDNARKLGISSPTPSIESLRALLAVSSRRGMRVKSLDVAHAFMHTPSVREVIVLRLPLSISTLFVW